MMTWGYPYFRKPPFHSRESIWNTMGFPHLLEMCITGTPQTSQGRWCPPSLVFPGMAREEITMVPAESVDHMRTLLRPGRKRSVLIIPSINGWMNSTKKFVFAPQTESWEKNYAAFWSIIKVDAQQPWSAWTKWPTNAGFSTDFSLFTGGQLVSACFCEDKWVTWGSYTSVMGQLWDSMKPLLSSTRDFGELVPAGDGWAIRPYHRLL